jgi:hypothetical protein
MGYQSAEDAQAQAHMTSLSKITAAAIAIAQTLKNNCHRLVGTRKK